MKKIITTFLLIILIFEIFCCNFSYADTTQEEQELESALEIDDGSGQTRNVGSFLLDGIVRNN